MIRGLILLLLAPLLLWIGFTQPLWHVLGMVIVLGFISAAWSLIAGHVARARRTGGH
jgi:hypothetical protein